MNRPLWIACVLMLAGALLWFGLRLLEEDLDTGVPTPVAKGDGADRPGAELAGDGTVAPDLDEPLEPHILTGLVLDAEGQGLEGVEVVARARVFAFGLSGRHSIQLVDQRRLAEIPRAVSRLGAARTDDGGRFALGGLDAHAPFALCAHALDPSQVLLTPEAEYAAVQRDVGRLVMVPALRIALRTEAEERVTLSAFAQRTVAQHGTRLHWYAAPFDPRTSPELSVPEGPLGVWVHQRGERHDLHALDTSRAKERYVLPVVDSNTRITVRVRNGAGQALPGVALAVWSGPNGSLMTPPGSLVLARTGADGLGALEDLRPGLVDGVMVQAPRFVRRVVPVKRRMVAGETLHLEVVLQPGADVTGTVVGPDDVPVAGARVRLGGTSWVQTDESGTFRLPDMPLGVTRIHWEASGFLPPGQPWREIIVRARGPRNHIRLRLERGAGARGQVVLPGGAPAPYALVKPHPPSHGEDPAAGMVEGVRADADGRFALGALAPGRSWTISARHGDFISAPLEPWIPVAGEPRTDLRIEVQPAGLIAGHVRDSEGDPVEAQTVRLLPFRRYQQVGEDGSFRFGHLPPGRYVVLLEQRREMIELEDLLGDGSTTRHEVEIKQGSQVTDLVLRAPSRAVLQGLLVDEDGAPVSGAKVEIHDKERAWIHANPGGMFLAGDHGGTVETDAAGRFRLAGLWGGDLDYVIKIDGVVAGENFRVPTPGLRIVRPVREGRKLTVRFRTPKGGAPTSGHFDWRLLRKDAEAWQGFEEEDRGRVAALQDGAVTLTLPKSGDHLWIETGIWRAVDGALAPWRRVERVRVPISGDVLTVALEEGGTLSGRVLDPGGQAVPYAEVELAYETTWPEYGDSERVSRLRSKEGALPVFSWPRRPDLQVEADADGSFTFRGLRDERCYLRALGELGTRSGASLDALPGAQGLELRVVAGASIRGRVLDPDGRGIARVKVGTSQYAWRGSVDTKSDGTFELWGLEPGSTHDVHVHADDGPALPYLPHTEQAVRAGGAPLELRLQRGVFLEGVVVDQAGVSVLEGVVEARRVGAPAGRDPRSVGISREGNHFQLGPLPAGEYDLIIGSGWNQDIKVFRTEPLRVTAPQRSIRLEVHRCWELSGRVEGGKGYSWKVYWCPAEPIELPGDDKNMMMGRPGDRRRTYLSGDGTFSFSSVREPQGDLYVFGPGDEYALLRDVTIDSGQLEIGLERGFAIGGRVQGAGKGRDLRLRQGGIERTFETSEGGTFLVRGLPPGTWILEAYNKYAHMDIGTERELLGPVQVEAGNTEVVYGAK